MDKIPELNVRQAPRLEDVPPPSPLTGLRLDPRTQKPVVFLQINGSLPLDQMFGASDNFTLRKVIEYLIQMLEKRGEKW